MFEIDDQDLHPVVPTDAKKNSGAAGSNDLPCEDRDDGEVLTDESDDDLYGDLESDIFERTATNFKTREELEKNIEELKAKLKKFGKERHELKSKVRSLTQENATLLSNATSLYETAKSEIDKKNLMLTQLQKSLQEFTKETGPSPNVTKEDLEDILQKCRDISRETKKVVNPEEIKKAMEEFHRKCDEKRGVKSKGEWSRKIRLNNLSIYFHSEQIPFGRLEEVKFPKKDKASHSLACQIEQNNSVEKSQPQHTPHSSTTTCNNNVEHNSSPPHSNTNSNHNQTSQRRPERRSYESHESRRSSSRNPRRSGHSSRSPNYKRRNEEYSSKPSRYTEMKTRSRYSDSERPSSSSSHHRSSSGYTSSRQQRYKR